MTLTLDRVTITSHAGSYSAEFPKKPSINQYIEEKRPEFIASDYNQIIIPIALTRTQLIN